MRINLLFLDIFTYVIRQDRPYMKKLETRVDHQLHPNFFTLLMTKEEDIKHRLNQVVKVFESDLEPEKAILGKKYDKGMVESLIKKIDDGGFEMMMSMVDKMTLNEMVFSFFSSYFFIKKGARIEMSP